ncbi:MAG: DNA repair exonuclease [Clostridium sp.]|nr:DNA repair exonuclease [Clostridium sp.]
MIPIKFIHTADIHLGSILNVQNEKLEYFDRAVYESFEKIVYYAIYNKVDFIIISGDLYDAEGVYLEAEKFFLNECKKLQENNIDVFIIGGNHDFFVSQKEIFKLPQNVHVFSSLKPETIEVKDKNFNIIARIIGQSYRAKADSRKVYMDYKVPQDGVFNIAMLHTQLSKSNLNYIPCSLNDLISNESIDYWALGHIHKSEIIRRNRPYVVFPGSPQGRDMGEMELSGCFLVDVNKDRDVSMKFLPTSSVIWKKVIIDINNDCDKESKNLSDLIEIMEKSASKLLLNDDEELMKIVKGYCIRWIISGKLKAEINDNFYDAQDAIIEELNSKFMKMYPFIYTDSIDFILEDSQAIESIMEKRPIAKDIYKLKEKIKNDDELKKELIGTFGKVMETDYDSENIDNLKIQLNDDDLSDILDRAFDKIVYKLMERKD